MIGVMFVCYGNICRSPMAEFLFLQEIKKRKIEGEFFVSSSATSYEEIGNGVHHGTRKILDRFGIDYSKKRACHLENQITKNTITFWLWMKLIFVMLGAF